MQIHANGLTLEIQDHGDPAHPALILIRGLGSQMVHWPGNLIQGFVKSGLRVITFDNRDVGLSQRCPAPGISADPDDILAHVKAGKEITPAYTLDDMAEDVIGLMDALAIARAHVFGISMGGAIAQILALNHPDRLLSDTIVMSTCRPLTDRANLAEVLAHLLVYPATSDQAEQTLILEYASLGSPGFPMPEKDIRGLARLAWSRAGDTQGINRQALATITATDRRADLARITTPCLVIHGIDDALINVERGAEIAAHIPASQYHAIEGMGHIITPLLAPRIISLVSDFIRGQG